ncbi:MAG: hypothetical protein II114_08520, partial [Treponema sp.]|nr:hypothetical protein [Treponema sp.]
DDGYGVRYNYAEYGGGIYNVGIIYLNTGHISYNGSSDSGGGINNQSGTINMSGGTIEGNYARSCGGGLFINVVTTAITMTGGYFYSNSAAHDGGAVWIGDAEFEMTGGTIGGSSKDNTCGNEYNGGAIYSGSTHSTFMLGGTAQIPGGSEKVNDIYLRPGKTIDLKSPLTAFSPAAKITLEDYTYNTQVVKPLGGVTNGDVYDACAPGKSLTLTSNSYRLYLADSGYTSIRFSDISSYQDIVNYPGLGNWDVSIGVSASTDEIGKKAVLIKLDNTTYAVGLLSFDTLTDDGKRPLSFYYKIYSDTGSYSATTIQDDNANCNDGGLFINLKTGNYSWAVPGDSAVNYNIKIEFESNTQCRVHRVNAGGVHAIP